MGILTNFIKGLKKSFSGKDYLREINQCDKNDTKATFFNIFYMRVHVKLSPVCLLLLIRTFPVSFYMEFCGYQSVISSMHGLTEKFDSFDIFDVLKLCGMGQS